MTGGPLSLNFVSTALSAGAPTVTGLAIDGLEACTGANETSGASPQISAAVKCRNRCLDMGKTKRTLGPPARAGQITVAERGRVGRGPPGHDFVLIHCQT